MSNLNKIHGYSLLLQPIPKDKRKKPKLIPKVEEVDHPYNWNITKKGKHINIKA